MYSKLWKIIPSLQSQATSIFRQIHELAKFKHLRNNRLLYIESSASLPHADHSLDLSFVGFRGAEQYCLFYAIELRIILHIKNIRLIEVHNV